MLGSEVPPCRTITFGGGQVEPSLAVFGAEPVAGFVEFGAGADDAGVAAEVVSQRQELLSFCGESSLCWYAVFDLRLPLPEGLVDGGGDCSGRLLPMAVWFPYLALAERRLAESAVPPADRLDTPLPA